jgi:triosephosphate isomerase
VTSPSRRPLVAGNWKMHPTSVAEAVGLARAVADGTVGTSTEVAVFPPAVLLPQVADALAGTHVAVGAQNMHAQDSGPFTGEISAPMLAGLARHVIVGHSERRQWAGETDDQVAEKAVSAVAHGLVPVIAIGERAEERQRGATETVIERQLRAAVSGLIIGSAEVVIAYEPVWAIGTGNPASPADAQSAAALIRGILAEADPEAAARIRILYGGSTTAELAPGIFAQPDVDGALVGGASLDAGAFASIVRAAAGR